MKTLTIEERHEVYKEAKQIHIKKHSIGFIGFLCDCFMEACTDIKDRREIVVMFPEFARFKPIKTGELDEWFNSEFARLACINRCIELTAPKP